MKVFYVEGDKAGWALDEDLRLLQQGLADRVEPSTLVKAEAVVAVWWWKLLNLPAQELEKRAVVAFADNPPFRYVQHPSFMPGHETVDLWVGRSRQAMEQFHALGLRAHFAPYAVDTEIFRPLAKESPELTAFASEWKIPRDAFLVGNFHRDTDGGAGVRPKFQKAPEALVEMLVLAKDAGVPVHAVLAGPRRHWIRQALTSRGIPYTFVGDNSIGGDDFPQNILPRKKLNLLFNLLDLYVIPSRWEGGPHSVLEAGAARCPTISTPVGVSRDLLAENQLFTRIPEAAHLLVEEYRTRALRDRADTIRLAVGANHTPRILGECFREILNQLPSTPSSTKELTWKKGRVRSGFSRIASVVKTRMSAPARVWLDSSGEWNVASEFLSGFEQWIQARRGRLALAAREEADFHLSPKTVAVGGVTYPAIKVERIGKRTTLLLFSVAALQAALGKVGTLATLTVVPPVGPGDPQIALGEDLAGFRTVVRNLEAGQPECIPPTHEAAEWVHFGGIVTRPDEEMAVARESLASHHEVYARLAKLEEAESAWTRVEELILRLGEED